MTDIVVDSGILITSVFPEVLTEQAQALLKTWHAEDVTLHAPTLFRYEVVAVARKAVNQGRITAEEGEQALDRFLQFEISLHFDNALLKRAYELATVYNRPTAYDSQYLALAERLSCDVWTADQRLFNATSAQLSYVYWLGNFEQGS